MLTNLKRRIGISDSSEDEMLSEILEYAKIFILSYTVRNVEQWLDIFEVVQLKIAIIEYERLGATTITSRAEGAVTTSFLGTDDYPKSISKALNPYRLVRVIK